MSIVNPCWQIKRAQIDHDCRSIDDELKNRQVRRRRIHDSEHLILNDNPVTHI